MQFDQLHFTKSRLAPTPSGYLHLGNVLSFALTAALAHKTGASIFLRIDDLDQNRVNIAYLQDIFDTLNFLGIPWDEGPRDVKDFQNNWSQLHRIGLYQSALQQLSDHRKVFACGCTRSELQGYHTYPGNCNSKFTPLDTPNTAWRLHTDNRELTIQTLNQGIIHTHLPATMKDFVVRKKDNYPAYQLASLVDDIHFGVDLVVRGEDLYPSTVAQHYLASSLGSAVLPTITFHHHPLLMESGNIKLSKSAGATSIKFLREHGHTPREIYNMIGKMLDYKGELSDWQSFTALL